MNKEPLGLYIFRFVLGLGLFAFMCMLYWSSVLIEEEVKFVISEIAQLKNDVFNLRSDINNVKSDLLLEIAKQQQTWHQEGPQTSSHVVHRKTSSNRPHLHDQYPNLLQDDPFYTVTLPKMLGENFKPKGVFHGATLGKPKDLHPFSNWYPVTSWISQCNVAVATSLFGKYETYSPDMALKMEERKIEGTDIPEYWVHLRDNVFWQPLRKDFFSEDLNLAPHFFHKHQVTAHDFKFYFDALMNPYVQEDGAIALRTYLNDIKEIEVIDNLTFVVRWKTENFPGLDGKPTPKIKYIAKLWTAALRPLASFVYQYFPDGKKIIEDDSDSSTYRTNSLWGQNFSLHWAKNIIVSCGPWIFDGMSDRQIKFKRNPDYYFPYATLVQAMEVQFKESPDNIWQDFKANKLDSYNIQPSQLSELATFLKSPEYQEQEKKQDAIKRLDYLMRSYTYLGWNQAKPYFKSKKVRQALTMAIDRRRIIKEYLNGMGIEINGSFFRYSPAYDESLSPWPFDLDRSRHLLEEEGWYDSDGDGIIDKEINGKRVPFRFSLTYYVKNPVTKSICEYVSTALKELGIACNLNGVDVADLSAAFDDKSFDAIYLAWMLGTPPEDPKQIFYSEGAKAKGSSNSVGFANAEADKIIDQLQYEYDPKKRIELYHRFDAILHEEQPYTFLYTPKTTMLYREYLQNVFIPADRQDLVPGANVEEPVPSIFWIKQ